MSEQPSRALESQNIHQLGAFRGFWNRSAGYPRDNFGNDRIHMPVSVAYEWADGRSRLTFKPNSAPT